MGVTVLSLLFASCGEGAPSTETDSSSPYFVDDASYLYFKNLRVKDYTVEERQTPRVEIYRHRQAMEPTGRPGLRIALIDNWLADEAYLQIDLVDARGESLGPATVSPEFADGSFAIGSDNPAEALALARVIQSAARQRRTLTLAIEGAATETTELDIAVADFGPQLTTIDDYLRLIDG